MRSLANTKINIEQGVVLDPDTDEPIEGSDTSVGGPYPASLIERRLTSTDPSDNKTPTFVRYGVLRVKQTVPVEVDQTIVDLKANVRWQIEDVSIIRNPMTGPEKRCTLRRLSS